MFSEQFLTDLSQSLALDCGITCDSYSEGGENFIDFHLITWAAPTEETYKAITDGFKALEINKEKYSISVSYDVSGFDYWMKQQEETQYGHLVVNLNEGFTMNDYNQLYEDFDKAANTLYEIQYECGLFTNLLLHNSFESALKRYQEAQR
jgi:hypothetical protein